MNWTVKVRCFIILLWLEVVMIFGWHCLQGNETMATIQNVISVIEGKEEPER